MTEARTVAAVLFDLGNTLWLYTDQFDMAAVHRLQAGRVAPLLPAWGVRTAPPLEEVQRDLWQAYETAWELESARGGVREPDRARIVQGALAVRGVTLTREQAEIWWREAWVPVRYLGVQLYPDTLDVLRALRERGLRIGVNSNRPCSGDMLWQDFEDYHMADCIDVAVCSGDTGFVKPHPSTFERALEMLQVPAAQVVMVGDSCERDCAPARALGMQAVLKLNGHYGSPRCDEADYTIHELGELLALPIFGRAVAPPESPTPHEDGNEDRY